MVDVSQTLQELIGTFMHHSMHRFVAFSKGQGLSMSQMGTLMMLHRKGNCAVSEIGEHLDISNAAASQLLNRLVDENLIERQEDVKDRRVKRIVITTRGNQTIEESMRARETWLENLSASLSPDEQDQVKAALSLLLEKVSQLDDIDEPYTHKPMIIKKKFYVKGE